MRLLPRSLAGRLMATAVIAIIVALGIASLAIGHVLGRFVMEGFDQRLDAQLRLLSRAVRPDGTLDAARAIDVPPFDEPGSGWAWQVTAPDGTLRSASLRGAAIAVGRLPPRPHHREEIRARPFESRAGENERVHGRMIELPTSAGPAELIATGPRWIAERPLHAAMVPLLVSITLLGLALALAVLVQLRLGLRPLGTLSAMVAEVRAGRVRRIDVDEPTELLPLVSELNALIDANEAGLAAARLHVANLAHGLKTPLATLRLDLAEPGRDPDGRLAAQVLRLEEQVRRHLGRARASDRGTDRAPAVPLAPVIADLVTAMARLHADRGIPHDSDIAAALSVRCDPQDLDEALGNLLDNAWRHARSRVAISAAAEGRSVRLRIGDDGAALDDARLAELQAGTLRADELGTGYGQGVRIARELIELHGGEVRFARSRLGGLEAAIALPSAATHAV